MVWIFWVYFVLVLCIIAFVKNKNEKAGKISLDLDKDYLAKYEHVGKKPIGAG